MRTLKKTLCLVLVLAMMVGLCAVGASAAKLDDYSDKDSIKNTEAVAVLSALGVLEGDERGFRPADTLTRAEGAAIMTRLFNTKGAGTSSYTDMASAAWAQPYVAYCENQGIIAGYGDGRFGPQDTLTVAAFAKMLLCALGYDAGMEGLTGNAWEINTVKLINKINLADGLGDLDYNAAVTRDQAAQLAFNALKADMVEYNGNIKVTTGDGTKVEVGANAKNIGNTAYTYTNLDETYKTEGTMQFCENYFPTLKVEVRPDDFGVNTDFWFFGNDRADNTYDDNKLAAQAMNAKIMATYTTNVARVKAGTLYTDGKLTETTTINVRENGAKATAVVASKGSTAKLYNANTSSYAGATLYLIDTGTYNTAGVQSSPTPDGKADTLIVEYPYLAKVNRIVAAADSATKSRQIALQIYCMNAAGTAVVNYDSEDFAKDDYVLVYPKNATIAATYNTWNDDAANHWGANGANIIKVEKAQSATGKITKVGAVAGNVDSLTLGETAYSVAMPQLEKNSGWNAVGAATVVQNVEYTAYLSNGYIVGGKATAVPYVDYVFVVGHRTVTSALDSDSTEIGFVKTDGTTGTVVSRNGIGTNPAYIDETTNANAWYSMNPEGPGFVFDRAPDAAYKQGALTNNTLKSDNHTIAPGIVANDDTVFVIKSGVAGLYKSYTGVKNVPTFKNVAVNAYALVKDGFAAVVYINMNGANAVDETAAPIYVYGGWSAERNATDGAKYYTYTVVKDGKKVDIEAKNLAGLTEGLYRPEIDANGIVTGATRIAIEGKYVANTQTNVAMAYTSGTLQVGGYAYAVGDDTVVYILKTPGNGFSVADPSALAGMTAATFSAIQVSDDNKKLAEIYVKNLTVTP
jgi:hypothetical protein